ncbi:MAG: xanthine dehydrogenase family protein molybdopterin-binding subunit [Burkholderiales bacterium]|nr:MAG: xanthine dehydrogenase family protein molybdopterin-binding subunit [Burkholderiales bacterium]
MQRRSFLVAAALAGGGLLVGCAPAARQQPRGTPLALGPGQVALNGWVKVSADGTVVAMMARSEMGQGVHTALSMLVAEELDCAWSQLRTEQAPIDALYGNVVAIADSAPLRPDDDGVLARAFRWGLATGARELGFNLTGGSTSVRDLWGPMREAAAVTRATLVEAVARTWSVPAAQVALDQGTFTGPGGRSMGFGDAVKALGATPVPASAVTLKDPSRFRVIGRSMPRDDALAKTTGRAVFGIDVRPPGLLHAAVRMSPVAGGRVVTFDGTRAKAMPGVAGVVSFEPAAGGSGGVAVVADRTWRAERALATVEASFDDGPMAGVSSEALMTGLARTLDTESGLALWKTGDAEAVIERSTRRVQAEYRAPWLAHATMEPMNCTVEYRGDSATVWAPTQTPGFARRAAAKALDLPESAVELRVTYLGGGFGRRLESDFVAQAAAIARAFRGRPVQVLWSREEDMRHDFMRPACVARYGAALDEQGRISAWRAVSAGQAPAAAYMPRNTFLPTAGLDKTALEGAYDTAYAFPAVRVAHVAVDLPVPVGFWRSVGHSHHAFFKESFVDECAHAAGADPLAYRLQLLAQRPRQRAVLELAAAKAGWGTPVPPAPDGARTARGIALHESFGATVAQVAEVSVAGDGTIRVHRVTCAIDCGLPVNPDGIAQQMEGGIVFGLSAALYGRVDIEQGRVRPGNFHEHPVLRLPECPAIDVHVVPSGAPPEGVGEPGVPPVAPAIANAVFALTGKRLRSLPLAFAA